MSVRIVEATTAVRAISRGLARASEMRREYYNCVLVAIDYADSPRVANRPGYVWVREWAKGDSDFGGVIPVLNAGAQEIVNLPVIVARSPRPPYQLQVLGPNLTLLVEDPGWTGQPFGTAPHGRSHTFTRGRADPDYGTDVAWVTASNLRDCAVLPTDPISMRCRVWPGTYLYRNVTAYFGGGLTEDLTARIPGAGEARLTAILVDAATNTLAYANGAPFPWLTWADPIPAGAWATVPEAHVKLSDVLLYNGMTAINERCFTYERRPLLVAVSDVDELGDLSDVGSATPTAGNLLEADGTDWESVGKGTMDAGDFGSGGAGAGDVLTADGAGGASWVPSTSGLPWFANYWPDTAPAGPSAYDDEFDDDAIDAKWISESGAYDAAFALFQTANNARADEAVYHGYLLMQGNLTLYEAFTPAINQAFAVVCKVSVGADPATNDSYFALQVRADDDSHYYEIRFGMYTYMGARVVYNNGGGAAAVNRDWPHGTGPAWLLISHDGAKGLSAFASSDGLVWSPLDVRRNMSNFTAFTRLRLSVVGTGAVDPLAALDYVRYWTTEGTYKIGKDV